MTDGGRNMSSARRRMVYITAFEGASNGHWGLYQSQVLNFVKTLNLRTDLTCQLVAVLANHQDGARLEKRCKAMGIPLGLVRVPKLQQCIPLLSRPRAPAEITCHPIHLVMAREVTAAVLAHRMFGRQPRPPALILDKRGIPEREVFTFRDKSIVHKVAKFCILSGLAWLLRPRIAAARFVTRDLREWCVRTKRCLDTTPFIIQPTSVLLHGPGVSEAVKPPQPGTITDKLLPDAVKIVYVGAQNEYQQLGHILSRLKQWQEVSSGTIQPVIISSFQSNQEMDRVRQTLGTAACVYSALDHARVMEILQMSDYGIISRDSTLINRVAAPTKIAEYLLSGLQVLYTGEIGIIRETEKMFPDDTFVNFERHPTPSLSRRSASERAQIAGIASVLFDVERQAESLIHFAEEHGLLPQAHPRCLEIVDA